LIKTLLNPKSLKKVKGGKKEISKHPEYDIEFSKKTPEVQKLSKK
jgi:hypothetical protein